MNLSSLLILIFFFSVSSSRNFKNDPDIGLNTVQMIESHGYTCESHTITTEDGYILTYHRIPNGKNSSVKQAPVLLMHGATGSSADYVNMGPNRSLAYILSDLNYDVWIANVRGNYWCRNHIKLNVSTNPEKFFDFSWHEMGYYDLPAAIDYILNITQADDLYYVGHSVGTTVFLVTTTTRPEYNKKIRLASLLAPISSMENQSNQFLKLVARFEKEVQIVAKALHLFEIPFIGDIRYIGMTLCPQPFFYNLCEQIIFQVVGADKPQFDSEKIGVLLTNTPSNAALKQFYHSAQLIKNGGFSQFDYGMVKNLKMYNSTTPLAYNLSKISTPVALYYGANDAVVNVKDVENLVAKLPNVVNNILVPYSLFSHYDFIYAKDVVKLLYSDLIALMKKY